MITSFKELVRKAPKDLQQVFWQQWKAPQNPTHHPEGNTLKHIAIVVTRAIKKYPDNINLILSAFFHDLGKFKTLAFNKNNQPTAHGHENVSVELVDKYKDWITSMGGNPDKIRYIVANHMKMKPQVWDVMKDSKKEKITSDPEFSQLSNFSKIDKGGTNVDEDAYAHVDSAAPENDEYKIGILETNSGNQEMKSKLVSLSTQFALAAQKVYDQWEQNERGFDEMYGEGGICDDIAEKMCEVVHQYTEYGCFLNYDEYACHTSIYVYDQNTKSLFFVDISPYNYETGGGYKWTKIPNVRFHSSMVDVHDQSGYWDSFFDEEGQTRDLGEADLQVTDQTEPIYGKDEYGDKTKEIVGQTQYKRFTYNDEIGGEASGSIYGDTARIITMQSVPSAMRYTPQEGNFKKRGFFKKLIKLLKNHGVKKIEINMQSNETQAAVKRLLQTGVLSNPTGIVGSSNNEHPTIFDIGNTNDINEMTDPAYSKWKRNNVTYRGMKELGADNGVYGSLGKGLYTTPASNKAMAKTYGQLYFVVNARPKNPKVFRGINDWEIFLQQLIIKKMGKYDPRAFYQTTTIENEIMSLGYDGVEIKGREMVNYKPDEDKIRYYNNERQLADYYDTFVAPNNISETGTVAEEYPSSFNQKEFESLRSFRERIQYCNTHLKKIAQGSSRIVYAIDDKMVLKLAKNGKGIQQNRTEAEIGVDHYFEELVAKTYNSSNDDQWVEMEYAQKTTPQRFQQLVGVDIDLLRKYVVNWHRESNSRQPVFPMTREVRDQLYENRFISHLLELMTNYEMQPYDITEIRNYGEVIRNGKPTIVLTDFGLNDDLWKTGYKRPVF